LLKTKGVWISFGFDKKTPNETTIKNSKNTVAIPTRNIFCLCFGDIKTTAINN
jgi:hypothetical protein